MVSSTVNADFVKSVQQKILHEGNRLYALSMLLIFCFDFLDSEQTHENPKHRTISKIVSKSQRYNTAFTTIMQTMSNDRRDNPLNMFLKDLVEAQDMVSSVPISGDNCGGRSLATRNAMKATKRRCRSRKISNASSSRPQHEQVCSHTPLSPMVTSLSITARSRWMSEHSSLSSFDEQTSPSSSKALQLAPASPPKRPQRSFQRPTRERVLTPENATNVGPPSKSLLVWDPTSARTIQNN